MEWASLGIAVAAVILSLVAIVRNASATSRGDLRSRVIESIQDLDDSIKAIEEYKLGGIILNKEQTDALMLAAKRKRESRQFRGSGYYERALLTTNQGIEIIERHFPPSQFPTALITRPNLGIWKHFINQ